MFGDSDNHETFLFSSDILSLSFVKGATSAANEPFLDTNVLGQHNPKTEVRGVSVELNRFLKIKESSHRGRE